jgi:hypothetical protein
MGYRWGIDWIDGVYMAHIKGSSVASSGATSGATSRATSGATSEPTSGATLGASCLYQTTIKQLQEQL